MAMADVVISTGGIGPTADDLTNETVGRITGKKLVRDQESVDHMKRIFASINRVMPENNLKQADLPETSEVIPNPLGTAPGFRMAVPQGDGHTCHLVVLPGVPREMKPMMEDSVIPWLRKQSRQRHDLRRARLPDLRHQRIGARRGGRRADQARGGAGRVSRRLPADFAARDGRGQAGRGRAQARGTERSACAKRVADFIYAEGDASMEQVVAQLLTETRPAARGRRILHRRPYRPSPHQRARQLEVLQRRLRDLFQRAQDRHARACAKKRSSSMAR